MTIEGDIWYCGAMGDTYALFLDGKEQPNAVCGSVSGGWVVCYLNRWESPCTGHPYVWDDLPHAGALAVTRRLGKVELRLKKREFERAGYRSYT